MSNTKEKTNIEEMCIQDIIKYIIDTEFSIAEGKISENRDEPLIMPTLYALDNKNINIIKLPFIDDETKVQMLKTAGRQCYKWKCHKIALVTDVAIKHYDDPKIINNPSLLDSTEQPLSYPVSMRTDAIFFQYMDLKNSKNNMSKTIPYTIEDNKIIKKEFDMKEGGVLKSRLLYHILTGFVSYFFVEKTKFCSVISREQILEFNKELMDIYPGIKDAPILSQ